VKRKKDKQNTREGGRGRKKREFIDDNPKALSGYERGMQMGTLTGKSGERFENGGGKMAMKISVRGGVSALVLR